MALAAGWLIVVALLTMAALEIGRYLRAQRNPDDFPYPRRRLVRRIAISLNFSALMLLIMFWPRAIHSAGTLLLLMTLLLAGVIIGFVMLLRDLRETSQAAVAHANALGQQTSEAFREILDKKKQAKSENARNQQASESN
jgi:hypothetical protein